MQAKWKNNIKINYVSRPAVARRLASCLLVGVSLFVSIATTNAYAADKIEVVHHLVSEGEGKAADVIRKALKEKGFEWSDSAVGGLDNVMQVIQSRLVSGNPPGAMLFSVGWDTLHWAEQGALRNLADIPGANDWQTALPPQIMPFFVLNGELIAAPINLHRENWVWANKKIFDDAGITVPKNWPELIASAETLKEKGIVPLAMSDERWQYQLVFDAVVADVNGPEFYKKALVDLDIDTLGSSGMVKVFDTLRDIKGITDNAYIGRDWAVATRMVIDGKAAMQVMGDWAKGEFLAKGLLPNKDFYCFATPAKVISFQYNVNSFAMFKTGDAATLKAQDALVSVILDKKVQEHFSLIKGGIPARTDISSDAFDDCGKLGIAERNTAVETGSLLGSSALGFATKPEFSGVFSDVISEFFVKDISSEDAVKMLIDGVKNAG